MKQATTFLLLIFSLNFLNAQWTEIATQGVWNEGGFEVIGTTLFMSSDLDGLSQSTDNGQTWTPLTGPWTQQIKTIGAHDGWLFVSADDGEYRSNDLGQTWQQLAVSSTTEHYVSIDSLLFALRPTGTLLRSVDNGTTWVACSGFSSNTTSGICGVVKVAGKLYSHRLGATYESTDWGLNWTILNNPLTNPYFASTIGAVGTTLVLIQSAFSSEYYYSNDFGSTWTTATVNGLPTSTFDTAPDMVYFDSMLWSIAGNRVYYSTNNGVTWTQDAALVQLGSWSEHFLVVGNQLFVVGDDNLCAMNGTSTTGIDAQHTSDIMMSFAGKQLRFDSDVPPGSSLLFYDAFGRIIGKQEVNSSSAQLPGKLSSGLYLVVLTHMDGCVSSRLKFVWNR